MTHTDPHWTRDRGALRCTCTCPRCGPGCDCACVPCLCNGDHPKGASE